MWCRIYLGNRYQHFELNKSTQHIRLYRIEIISVQNNTLKVRVFHPTYHFESMAYRMKQGCNIWCCKKIPEREEFVLEHISALQHQT